MPCIKVTSTSDFETNIKLEEILDYFRKFFKSANFDSWLRVRTHEVNKKLQALHVEALCKAVSIVVSILTSFPNKIPDKSSDVVFLMLFSLGPCELDTRQTRSGNR